MTTKTRAAATGKARDAVRELERSASRKHAGAARVRASFDGKAAAPRVAAPSRAITATRASYAPPAPPRLSMGQAAGLHEVYDPLALHSSVAFVLDAASGEVLLQKNAQAVLPIASITKLMTAMVVLDMEQPLDELLEVSEADIDTERFSRSRLRPGTLLSRDTMLQLALMSSENRAANALGRHYPGGLAEFVSRMNAKAREIGMTNTRFVEPTGLSSSNVSNAVDLSRLVRVAATYPLVRSYSTASSLMVDAGARPMSFHNTNRLVDQPDWYIGLQKTGYISDAGNCLVMGASIEGRPIVIVLLDAAGRHSRFGDAERIRSWLVNGQPRFDAIQRAQATPSRG